MSETLFEELKRYVDFTREDEEILRALHPVTAPRFAAIADHFYQRILENDGARKVLVEGESMVGRLKVTLIGWMDKLLSGPWDEAYFELRCRIGRVHVRIHMPQHYMFGGMNVLRRQLTAVVEEAWSGDREKVRRAREALGKVLDLELAVMLHTYREDLLAAQSRAERLATFGQLVGSIGHELRNPLGVIESSLYILKGRVGDERAQKHVQRIGEQLGMANQIITDLLEMIRDRPLQRGPVQLGRVVRAAAEGLRLPADLSLSLEGFEALPPLDGDEGQLRQVLVNLLDNAVHAAGPAGRVRVVAAQEPEAIAVAVEDSGPGVDPTILPRLFEPLVTTKAKGVGLGLALVRRIVERHGGAVACEPRGPGGRFVLRFPVARGQAA